MSTGPIRLAARGPAGRGLGMPGPPARDPRLPSRAEERKHQATRREIRKAIEAKGHRLARFRVRPRSFGWRRWAWCDLQRCLLRVEVNHRTEGVIWYFGGGTRDVELAGDETVDNVPECRSPMAMRSSSEPGGGTNP